MTKISNLYALTNYVSADLATGKVGIGTSSPSEKLHVVGSIYSTQGYFVPDSSQISYTTYNGNNGMLVNGTTGLVVLKSGGNETIFLNSSGNVGIGASPSYKLDVNGTGRFTGALTGTSGTFSGNVSTSAQLRIESSGNAILLVGSRTSGTVFEIYNSTNVLRFYNGTNEALKIETGAGAATFSSSVTAEGNIATKSGNSVVFYRPDNAIYTSLYDAGSGAGNGFILNNTNGEGFHFKNATSSIMRLSSAGNVGIGTTSPKESLEIAGLNGNIRIYGKGGVTQNGISSNVYYNGSAWVRDNGSTGAGAIRFDSDSNSIVFNTDATTSGFPAERMRIASGGNVLIGQTTASGSTNGIYFRPGIESGFIVTSDVALQLSRLGTTGDIQTFYSGTTRVGKIAVGSSTVTFESANNGGLAVNSSGYVGIGVSSATYPLDVASSGGIVGRFIGNSGAYIVLQNNGVRNWWISNGIVTASDGWFGIYNATAGVNAFNITSGNNVLIGTTTDYGGKLQVSGGITINGSITNLGTGSGTYTQSVWYNNTTDQVLFENGRTTDSAAGTGRTVYFTWRGGPSVGGGVQLQHGTNSWAAYTSDARLKTIVANVDNGLEAIMKLNPIKYKWTKELETSRTVLGFTAQNVGDAIPEAMFKSWKDEELGDVLSYYQEYLTPYLVKAIQELSAKVTALENN